MCMVGKYFSLWNFWKNILNGCSWDYRTHLRETDRWKLIWFTECGNTWDLPVACLDEWNTCTWNLNVYSFDLDSGGENWFYTWISEGSLGVSKICKITQLSTARGQVYEENLVQLGDRCIKNKSLIKLLTLDYSHDSWCLMLVLWRV